MSTRRYKFVSLVKCGQMRLQIIIKNTSPTDINYTVRKGVCRRSLLQNFLTDLQVSVVVFKVPYMVLSSMLIPLLGLLNDALWFTKRVLKAFWVSPT